MPCWRACAPSPGTWNWRPIPRFKTLSPTPWRSRRYPSGDPAQCRGERCLARAPLHASPRPYRLRRPEVRRFHPAEIQDNLVQPHPGVPHPDLQRVLPRLADSGLRRADGRGPEHVLFPSARVFQVYRRGGGIVDGHGIAQVPARMNPLRGESGDQDARLPWMENVKVVFQAGSMRWIVDAGGCGGENGDGIARAAEIRDGAPTGAIPIRAAREMLGFHGNHTSALDELRQIGGGD